MSVEVMAAVWRDSAHNGNTLLVLLALANRADEYGVCWPSVGELMKRSRLSRRAVQHHLRLLEDSGEVAVLERGGKPGEQRRANKYRVTLSLDSTRAEGCTGADSAPVQNVPTRAVGCAGTRAVGCAPTTNKTSELQEPPKPPEPLEVVFETWREAQASIGKDAKRLRLTDERRKKVKARLESYPVDDIVQAIANVHADAWFVENSHTELIMICRNDSKLEQYRDMKPRRTSNGSRNGTGVTMADKEDAIRNLRGTGSEEDNAAAAEVRVLVKIAATGPEVVVPDPEADAIFGPAMSRGEAAAALEQRGLDPAGCIAAYAAVSPTTMSADELRAWVADLPRRSTA